ncbi:hypothetical protein [Asanoa siamensis]|uniref:VapC45 PIN like domain-containing protein n=1 Tax=Asanoa siamensis TaxID=926357 RepID=A0ABQ4CSM4_9ACTN|nr:hypothetical protein [Asanoa siamensis]GIF74256.1 hypothetical protein Asi02nite_37740 [Asanoa siamensis]
MSRLKPAKVRYYIDADILGLGHVLARLRPDVTYPGDPGGVVHRKERPACIVEGPHQLDVDWIGPVSAMGWLIITRDGQIQAHSAELNAVRKHGARMVALATGQAHGTFEQLEIVMCQWRAIAALLNQPGPFIYVASRTSLRAVSLG